MIKPCKQFLIYWIMAGVVYAQISLSVNAIPKRVEVLLDGNSIGTTPIRKNTITPGSHMFKIEKEGYAPINYDIVVNPSKAINLDFFMNPVYNIKFKTDEKGLIFELNDTHRWTEKTIGLQLEAGDHHLRVFRIDEVIDEQVILVDQPLTFQYYLKKKSKITPAK